MSATLPHIPSRTANGALAEEKRALIETAAFRCFSLHGYHGTTIELIATAAGMSVGSVYRYIQRKEDILLLVLDRLLRVQEAELSQIVSLPLPPPEKLHAAIAAYYGTVARDPDRVRIAYRETWVLDKERRDYIKQRELETSRYLEAIVQEGIDQGCFRPVDPHLVAYNILVLGHMWALKGWHLRQLMTLEEYIQRQVELVRAYLSPESSSQRGMASQASPRAVAASGK